MVELTPQGRARVVALSARHGASFEATLTLLRALIEGDGKSARFDHPELGGAGEWLAGGPTILSDLFNHDLKAKVAALCGDLAAMLDQVDKEIAIDAASGDTFAVRLFEPTQAPRDDAEPFWPAAWSVPDRVVRTPDLSYAVFDQAQRLALIEGGQVAHLATDQRRIERLKREADGLIVAETDQGEVMLEEYGLAHDEEDVAAARVVPTATATSGADETRSAKRAAAPASATAPMPSFASTPLYPPPRRPRADTERPAVAPSAATPASTPKHVDAPTLQQHVWHYLADATERATLRFVQDGRINGGGAINCAFWEFEDGDLLLFAGDGVPVARLGRTAGVMEGALELSGRAAEESIRLRALPDADAPRSATQDGAHPAALSLSIPLTERLWQLRQGEALLNTLRFEGDGSIEGAARASEATWRFEPPALVLLHRSGRPTARFAVYRHEADGWTLLGRRPGETEDSLRLRPCDD